MPNCPKCNKPVYFAEKKTSLGKDWHASCLRCSNPPCNKVLTPGSHSEHEGQPYCNQCHRSLFGPKRLTNVLVLFIVARYRRMRTVTNILIFNLCLADLIYILFLPIVIAFQIHAEWKFGLVLCKSFYIAESTAKYASVYFVSVLSFDRYLAICRPQWCKRYRCPTAAAIVSLAGWLLTAALMIPMYLYSTVIGRDGSRFCTIVWPSTFSPPSLVSYEENEELLLCLSTNNNNTTCFKYLYATKNLTYTENETLFYTQMYQSAQVYFVISTFVFCFGIPAIAILYFYIKVVDQLIQASCRAERLKRSYEKTYKKVTRMVLAVITGYMLCWLPYWIQLLMVTFISDIRLNNALKIVFNSIHLLPYLNCAVNPILYSMMTENFKNSFAEMCSGASCCRVRPDRYRASSVNSVRRESTWRRMTNTTSLSTRCRPSATRFEKIRGGCEIAELLKCKNVGLKSKRRSSCAFPLTGKFDHNENSYYQRIRKHRPSFGQLISGAIEL